MGIPSTGDRLDAQNYMLRRVAKKYEDRIELVYPDIFVSRIFHDFARNKYVEQFLASDCDILWFLDSDVLPPDRVLDLVTEHGDKWDLAGAPYPVWMTVDGYEDKQVLFCVYKALEGSTKLHAAKIPFDGSTDFVEGIATGCIFIKRKVLEEMTKPYFEFKYNEEDRSMTEGEDLGFCLKANKLGYKFFTDYSMLCHHFKKVSLLDVSTYTQFQVQQAIDASDTALRQILAKKKLERMAKQQLPQSRLILPNR